MIELDPGLVVRGSQGARACVAFFSCRPLPDPDLLALAGPESVSLSLVSGSRLASLLGPGGDLRESATVKASENRRTAGMVARRGGSRALAASRSAPFASPCASSCSWPG